MIDYLVLGGWLGLVLGFLLTLTLPYLTYSIGGNSATLPDRIP